LRIEFSKTRFEPDRVAAGPDMPAPMIAPANIAPKENFRRISFEDDVIGRAVLTGC
jgi:hypothetical protein